jgi:hypothetical protein
LNFGELVGEMTRAEDVGRRDHIGSTTNSFDNRIHAFQVFAIQ